MNPLLNKFEGTRIILGTNSPRRIELFKQLGLPYEVIKKEIDESYPEQFRREDIAMFLARKKSLAFKSDVADGGIVITADTIVALDELIIGKPKNLTEAEQTLRLMSGRKHSVITGVAIMSAKKSESFFVKTEVSFKTLRSNEIEYYLATENPLDKAGAYGIQDWIGLIGIEYILGSYYNVVGLPTKELYENLLRF
ncbi:MAG: septum formation protein Maf [Bacteroidia bacterium]|nr:septum formation protein Maf [Bacteroidia bacterium]MBP7244811.1 septum formation protein Maf [Bacteroidia bacterium]